MSEPAETPKEKEDPLAPSVYTVRVTHGWDGEMAVEVKGIAEPDHRNSRESMAQALRLAADAVEKGHDCAVRRPGPRPNVVSLRGGDFDCVKAASEEPDQALVKTLANVFKMARDGKLRSFIGTGFTADARMTCFAGAIGADVYAMDGALGWLQDEYRHRIRTASDAPLPPKGAG